MKKTILLTILFCFVAIVIVMLSNPLIRSEEALRKKILKDTPVGTQMDDILKYIERRNWEKIWVSDEHGFVKQDELSDPVIGVKSIRAGIGEHRFIFVTSVTAFWGFNENSELIDVWVWKTVDAP